MAPFIKIIRAKLHGIYITDANLNYHGSITLDPEHCKLAGIYPLEFVDIWNKSSGARISTYVIYGVPGSRCCVLNGAAARTCQQGDEIIIAASDYCEPKELLNIQPQILTFDKKNNVASVLTYNVTQDENQNYQFSIGNLDGKNKDSFYHLKENMKKGASSVKTRGKIPEKA